MIQSQQRTGWQKPRIRDARCRAIQRTAKLGLYERQSRHLSCGLQRSRKPRGVETGYRAVRKNGGRGAVPPHSLPSTTMPRLQNTRPLRRYGKQPAPHSPCIHCRALRTQRGAPPPFTTHTITAFLTLSRRGVWAFDRLCRLQTPVHSNARRGPSDPSENI